MSNGKFFFIEISETEFDMYSAEQVLRKVWKRFLERSSNVSVLGKRLFYYYYFLQFEISQNNSFPGHVFLTACNL